MQTIKIRKLNNLEEEIYYTKLASGLQLYFIKKEGFKEYTCVLTSLFGSLDNSINVSNQIKSYPLGVAHFLEHKLFDQAEEKDVSLLFADYSAETNAFTTYDKTSYYFSTSSNISECLTLLQTFVQNMKFTEESLSKEKDIICQEIDMYQDDSDYQLYQGILSSLYPESPLADDIAGTKESVKRITFQDLKANHNYFYHPTNLILVVVGDSDIEEISDLVQKNQKQIPKKEKTPISRKENFNYLPIKKNQSKRMSVTLPKLAIGYRGVRLSEEKSLLRQYLSLKLFFSLFLGWTSDAYQKWYENGQINDSFQMEIEVHKNFQFLIITLDTIEPIAMSNKIRNYLLSDFPYDESLSEHFESLKKDMYGDFLRCLDSIEHLALQFVNYLSEKDNYYDIPNFLKDLTLEEIIQSGKLFLEGADSTDFIIFPK